MVRNLEAVAGRGRCVLGPAPSRTTAVRQQIDFESTILLLLLHRVEGGSDCKRSRGTIVVCVTFLRFGQTLSYFQIQIHGINIRLQCVVKRRPTAAQNPSTGAWRKCRIRQESKVSPKFTHFHLFPLRFA